MAKVSPIATPNPLLENNTLPATGWPALALAGKVNEVAASAAGVTVVAAAEVGVTLLLTKAAEAATEATFKILPLPLPAVPLTIKVTLDAFGKAGMAIPTPWIFATVKEAGGGHCAPPAGALQVTLVAVKLAAAGSFTRSPLASAGPVFAATSE
jgi:hypothetical protein